MSKSEKLDINFTTLVNFLKSYWFIPSDVLQRSVEADIWSSLRMKKPILSIGIGNGELDSFLFKKQGIMDIGIDIDDSQFDKAKNLGIYKRIMMANAEKMPFKNSQFNSVISNSTFEHIGNLDRAIQEVSRVLKKEGLLVFTTPSDYLKEWILDEESKNGKREGAAELKKFNQRANHINYLNLDEWKILLSKNKLELISHKYFFPKDVAIIWYKLFKMFTKSINNREIWSYLGHSKFARIIPKEIIIKLEFLFLKSYFREGSLMEKREGAQHFIIARKK